jgi:hypothetical protein
MHILNRERRFHLVTVVNLVQIGILTERHTLLYAVYCYLLFSVFVCETKTKQVKIYKESDEFA